MFSEAVQVVPPTPGENGRGERRAVQPGSAVQPASGTGRAQNVRIC